MATKNLGRVKGTTFTPSVDTDGNLTWSNDGGETNPSSVNIKGEDGTSATIEVNTDTDDEYTLKITDKNGEKITPNLKGGGGGTVSSDDIATAVNDYFTNNPVDNSIQYSTMPTASADNVGEVIQYIGATDTDYIKGEFYESVLGDDGTIYSWVKVESPLVTESSDGAMSMTDKVKLNNIEEGAEVNPVMVSEFTADNDYYDKGMISDIAREIHKGKVTQGHRDIVVIPDKYNTGVESDVTLTTFAETATLGSVLSDSGDAVKITYDSDNSRIMINAYSNRTLADECLIEGYDFSEFVFTTLNQVIYTTNKKIYFKNCKFAQFRHDQSSLSNLSFDFEHCIFNGCVTGSNMTLTSCYIGDSKGSDGINPNYNVHINDCFVGNLLTTPDTSATHVDGIQIYGNANYETKDISLKNVRFAIPNFYFDGTATSYVNGAIMCSLEYNNADNILFEDIIIDMGGKYTPFYNAQPPSLTVTNVLFKNCIVSDNYKSNKSLFYQSSYNELTKVIDTHTSSNLYVSSVWKDDDNKTHLICTNNSVLSDKSLVVKTNLGDYEFTLDRSPTQTELLEDSIYQTYTFENMPYDIEFTIEEDIDYLICYDGDTQIRFVNFTDEDIYLSTDSLSFVNANTLTINLEPNTIYDFGQLGADDALNITFNIPENKTGAEIWHFMFTAGSENQNISAVTSDGSALKFYGKSNFVAGTTYEVSMLNNVVIVA